MSIVMATAAGQAELVAAADQASAPVAVGRRFSFVGIYPRIGVSAVVALTSFALARRRSGRTLAVATSLGLAIPASVPPGSADDLPKAVRDRLGYSRGVFVLPLDAQQDDPLGRPRLPSAHEWRAQVAPAARYFDIVCTDWASNVDLTETLDRSRTGQAVCVVAPYTRTEGEYSVALARALHRQPGAPAVMVAFVETARTGSTWPRMVSERLPFPVVRFGYDARLAAGASPSVGSVRAAILTGATLMRLSDPAGRP